MTDNFELYHGDCIEEMSKIESGAVDLILVDPPYGTIKGMGSGYEKYKRLANSQWDETLPHDMMLSSCDRILRTNGALIIFSQEPYTGKLTTRTHENLPFSYRMVWKKDHFANSLIAKKAPVNYTEDICVFFKKYDTLMQHPIRSYAKLIMKFTNKTLKDINNDLGHRRAEHFFYVDSTQFSICTEKTYRELVGRYGLNRMEGFLDFCYIQEEDRKFSRKFNLPEGKKYKSNHLEYRKDYDGFHPTQKPVLLLEDLIKTYTDEGDTVLDFTMGSGSTGVACMNTNRRFIGIERDDGYFSTAKERIESVLFQ